MSEAKETREGRFEPPPGFRGAAREAPRRPPPGEPRLSTLSKPPREVPLSVRVGNLAGGGLALFGWLFGGFGMIFVWVFATQGDYTAWWDFRGEVATVQGVVDAVEETSFSQNDTPVHANRFTFATPDGTLCEGTSYSTGRRVEPGQAVTVEHPPGRPSAARIEGLRRAKFSPWVALVFIFPAVGAGLAGAGLAFGHRANRLLKYGRLAMGTLESCEPTNTRVNKQTVYKLRFRFEAGDGKTYEVTARTHRTGRLMDEETEPLLYDPMRPEKTVLVDQLAAGVWADRQGRLHAKRPLRGLLAGVLPMAVIFGHGTALLVHCFG